MDEARMEAYAERLQFFVGVSFRAGLGAFPLLFAANTVLLGSRLSPVLVAGGALLLAFPVAVEFTLSDRDVDRLEEFVGAVLLLWLVAVGTVVGAGALGVPRARAELAGFVLVLAAYAVAALLTYTAWGRRWRGSAQE